MLVLCYLIVVRDYIGALLSCLVDDKGVFEFSDYFWGMIIDKAEVRGFPTVCHTASLLLCS